MFKKKEDGKIKELEQHISNLEKRIWELENPAKYKSGQIVKVDYVSNWHGKIETTGLITDKSEVETYFYLRDRKYPIINKFGRKFYVPEHGIKEVVEQDAFNCIEE